MKKINNKIIFLIFTTILLTSCSVDWFVRVPSKNTSITADYPSNKKGLVIVRMLSPVIVGWRYYSLDEDLQYQKSDVDIKTMTWGPGNYQVLMLDPGIYSAEYFRDIYTAYNAPFSFRGEVLSYDGVPTIGAFEVRSGVVSYVGDLEFRNVTQLNIKDDYKAAKLFFKKNYPQVNSPIIKSLTYTKSNKAND